MKKLIALLIVLSLCLSSCALVEVIFQGDASGNTVLDNWPPQIGGKGDDDSDDSGNSTGTGSGNKNENFVDNGDTGCAAEKHTDMDNNGSCDYCSVSVIVVVDILAVNDLHGKVTSSSTQPGLGGLTTYLRNEADEGAILISSGDMWQGTAESGLTYGAIMTDWMSEVGFVSMTIGNHEYDWSEQYLYTNHEIAEFPFLGINVYSTSTGQRATYATPSVVVERDGVQIGIIGAIGDCYSSISGDVTGGFTFKTGSALTALVKAEAERLRAEGVDFIVYSIHDGSDSSTGFSAYYDESLSDGYVDLVFEAHTHQTYVRQDSYGVYHLQGGGENKGLSRAEININSANGSTSVSNPKTVNSVTWQYLDTHPIVTELLEKYGAIISKANEKLGYNKSYRDDSVLEQIIADLYYQFGLETWGDQYDVTLGGGFIRTRSPYNMQKGDIYYSDVYSLFTFNNDIVLCSISGSDLLSKFINSSNSDYYISAGVNASSIDQNKTYYIVVDTYTSTYRYNNLTEVARVSEIYARDLLAEYIKSGGLA